MESEAGSSDGWCLANHSVDVDISLLLRLVAELTAKVCWVRLWMARGEAGHDSLHHAHRVGLSETFTFVGLNKSVEFRVYTVVLPNFVLKSLVLRLRGQLAIDK